MPIICPICHGTMSNEFIENNDKEERLVKRCSKRLNHKITFSSYSNNDCCEHIVMIWVIIIIYLYE